MDNNYNNGSEDIMSFNLVADSLAWAEARRERYREDVDNANAHYRATGNVREFQALNAKARESWEADIREHFTDLMVESRLRDALAQGGRVYATLDTGETVPVRNINSLYEVSNITGSPAAPLVARMVGDFIVKHTTVADLITRA